MCVACTQSAYVYLNVCRAEQMTQVNTTGYVIDKSAILRRTFGSSCIYNICLWGNQTTRYLSHLSRLYTTEIHLWWGRFGNKIFKYNCFDYHKYTRPPLSHRSIHGAASSSSLRRSIANLRAMLCCYIRSNGTAINCQTAASQQTHTHENTS